MNIKKMKVLHIFYEINFSGAEIMYATAAPQFIESGVDLYALSTGKTLGAYATQFEEKNIKLLHKPLLNDTSDPVLITKYAYAFYSFLKDSDFDIVHIHRSNFYWLYSICAFFAGKKVVRTIHNVFRHHIFGRIKAISLRFIMRNIFRVRFQTIGSSVYNHEIKYFMNKSTLVNNWFDPTRFSPTNDGDKEALKDSLLTKGIGDPFMIISTGSCTAVKNHSDILKALAIVIKEFPCIYLHLGSGEDLNCEKQLAQDLGIEDFVYFLGNKSNVRDYLHISDVYVMPSRFEGLSIAAIEAMACGVPSILYNSDGLRDLIVNGNNGFLIKHDHRLLAEKIIYYKNNPEYGRTVGSNSIKFVNENFSLFQGVNGILELYHN